MALNKYFEQLEEKKKPEIVVELEEDELKQYLNDIIDAGYKVTYSRIYGASVKGVLKELNDNYFDRYCPLDGGDIHIGYAIDIMPGGEGNEDITIQFQQAIRRIVSQGYKIANIDCQAYYYDDGDNDWDKFLENYFFVNGEVRVKYAQGTQRGESLSSGTGINILQTYPQEFNSSFIKEEFGTDVKDVEVSHEDLVNIFIKSSDNYYEALIDGWETLDDHYHSEYYYPQGWQDLFDYHLSEKNGKLLLECMIKAHGLKQFTNDCFAGDQLYGKTKEEVIEFIYNERFRTSLKNFSLNEFDCVQDTTSIIADYQRSAHVDENLNEINSAFESLLDTALTAGYAIFENPEYDGKYYRIYFDFEWMYWMNDIYQLQDLSFEDIFYEFFGREGTTNLKANLSDYGDYSNDDLNKEVYNHLEHFLK